MMLSPDQIAQFYEDGYLVVPDVLPPEVIDAVKTEYAQVLDRIYSDWQSQGLVKPADGFWAQLSTAYAAGCDWFQPLDISLPGGPIATDTPMHFGPAMIGCSIW